MAGVSNVVRRELLPLKIMQTLEAAASKASEEKGAKGKKGQKGDGKAAAGQVQGTAAGAAAPSAEAGAQDEAAPGEDQDAKLKTVLGKVGRAGREARQGLMRAQRGKRTGMDEALAPSRRRFCLPSCSPARRLHKLERVHAERACPATHQLCLAAADAQEDVGAAQVEPGDGGGARQRRDNLLLGRLPAHWWVGGAWAPAWA